jgi:hypothetical protein
MRYLPAVRQCIWSVIAAAVVAAGCGGDGEERNDRRDSRGPTSSGPSASGVPAGWRSLVNPATGVRFSFPGGWRRKGDALAVEDGRGSVCDLGRFSWTAAQAKKPLDELTQGLASFNEEPPGQRTLNQRTERIPAGEVGRFELLSTFRGRRDPGPVVTIAVVKFGRRPDALTCNASFHDRFKRRRATFERMIATLAPD